VLFPDRQQVTLHRQTVAALSLFFGGDASAFAARTTARQYIAARELTEGAVAKPGVGHSQ
jgi:hypothetical protein